MAHALREEREHKARVGPKYRLLSVANIRNRLNHTLRLLHLVDDELGQNSDDREMKMLGISLGQLDSSRTLPHVLIGMIGRFAIVSTSSSTIFRSLR